MAVVDSDWVGTGRGREVEEGLRGVLTTGKLAVAVTDPTINPKIALQTDKNMMLEVYLEVVVDSTKPGVAVTVVVGFASPDVVGVVGAVAGEGV